MIAAIETAFYLTLQGILLPFITVLYYRKQFMLPYGAANILRNPLRAYEPLQGEQRGSLVRRLAYGDDLRAKPFLASNAKDMGLRCGDECQLPHGASG